jgi:hypothetical protein
MLEQSDVARVRTTDGRRHDKRAVVFGSAKVALISVERSEIAWRTIAAASSDPVATILADQLAAMRELLAYRRFKDVRFEELVTFNAAATLSLILRMNRSASAGS